MADIFSNHRLTEQLVNILDNANSRDRLYVYRVRDGKLIKPAVVNRAPFPGLLQHLRDELGGGDFKLLIRRSDRMILAGTIAIGRNHRAEDQDTTLAPNVSDRIEEQIEQMFDQFKLLQKK